MKENEKFMLDLVAQGVFSIDDKGQIWRLQVRGSKFRDYHPLPQKRRAETKNGQYWELNVTHWGISYRAKAHRIVWAFFHSDIDDNLTINHINGNKTDNRPENLELISVRENLLLAHEAGLISGAFPGEKHPMAKLTETEVLEIIELYETGQFSQEELGIRFKIGQGQIGKIVRGERWKHVIRHCTFSRYGAAKLTPGEVLTIRKEFAFGKSIKELTSRFKIGTKQIKRIVNREAWKHI